jgi:hypothetical protein
MTDVHHSSEKQPLRWIYLCWIMLSSVAGEQIPLAGGTIVLGRRGSFEAPYLVPVAGTLACKPTWASRPSCA